LKKKERLDKTN